MTKQPLVDPKLEQSVCCSARTAAERFAQISSISFRCQLGQTNSEILRRRANEARTSGWYGALPSWEPADGVYSIPDGSLSVVGVDGSQIYPDPMQPVQWAYLQALAYSVGNDPVTQCDYIDLEGLALGVIHRYDLPEDLLPHSRELKAQIDYQRSILEMKTAVKTLEFLPGRIILMDMPLVVWPPSSNSSFQKKTLLNQFYSLLNRLHGYPVAGVISSPTSSYLQQMLTLVNQDSQTSHKKCFFQDRFLLMDYLQPGERTALFELGGVGNDMASTHQASIYFFYLCINDYEIARIEIPAWVAKDRQMVAQIHASIYQDSLALGYSHALSMAHHLVSIPNEKAAEMNQLASDLFFDQPNNAGLSAKIRMKLGWEAS